MTSSSCLLGEIMDQGRWEELVFRVNLKYVTISKVKTVIKIMHL